MKVEDAHYVLQSIEQERFDYCFDGYDSFLDIEDEKFHELRLKYLESKKNLLNYLIDSSKNI